MLSVQELCEAYLVQPVFLLLMGFLPWVSLRVNVVFLSWALVLFVPRLDCDQDFSDMSPTMPAICQRSAFELISLYNVDEFYVLAITMRALHFHLRWAGKKNDSV